jgi:branched-chain amino acid transport system permease protein
MKVVPNAYLALVASGLLALLLLPPNNNYVQLLITEIGMYALLALAFDVSMGFTGMLSLATALYFGLGAYFFVYGSQILGFGIAPALVISAVMVVSAAAVTGVIAVRLRGPAFLVVTLIFVTASHGLAQSWKGITGGDDGLVLDPERFHLFGRVIEPVDRYRIGLCVFAIGFFATVAVIRSPIGRLFRGVKENEFRLEMLGYRSRVVKLIAYCWAALLSSLAGSIYVIAFGHVHTGLFHWSISANALIWAFFGGLGSLIGPLLGVGILVPFEDNMSSWVGYPRLFTGLLLVLIVLIHRDGVIGLLTVAVKRATDFRGAPSGKGNWSA